MTTSSDIADFDEEIRDVVRYVYHFEVNNERSIRCARTALLDALGCAIESVARSADCRRIIGPTIPGTSTPNGCRIPGTSHVVDPVKGSFDLGTLIRYLDHNDALAGKDWGHPSDNIGALLPVMDWLCRDEVAVRASRSLSAPALTLRTLLEATIKAYEIQGCMLLRNAFNEYGLDHTILVKLASAAVVPWLFGMTEQQAAECISHVWMDSAPLRVYRSGVNTIPRKGWAAGDACRRAVEFALLVRAGQPGSRTPLSQPRWGFYTTSFRSGSKFVLPLRYSDWVIRNVFYKVMPVEGHGIAAVEASVIQSQRLRQRGVDIMGELAKIEIRTTAAAKLIIDKAGPLRNHADRDHCLQYAVAVALLKGSVPDSMDFDDDSPFAISHAVDQLRARMEVKEDEDLTADYLSLDKKSIPSAVTVHLRNGEVLEEVTVDFPCGHVERPETMGEVQRKFRKNLSLLFNSTEVANIESAVLDHDGLLVSNFTDMLVRLSEEKSSPRL